MILHCLLSLVLCQMIHDRPVAALTAAQASVTAWDYTQTRMNIQSGGGENDPLVRPFAHSTPAIVAAGAAETLGAAYIAERMRHSDRAFVRRTWWVPQAIYIGLHIGGGIYSTTHRNGQ